MSAYVEEILSWYESDGPGVKANLYRILMSGALAGTGKLIILPVDQGFEHGPARSFAVNAAAYSPYYHFELAIEGGFNAYAAPLGFIEAGAARYAGRVPLILKINNSDTMLRTEEPCPAITGSVREALRLGCSGIGFTIYPGSNLRNAMYEQIRAIAEEAKAAGLVVAIWSYPRGAGISKAGETALDTVAYAAHVACLLGAHLVKVKPPSAYIEQLEAKKVYEAQKVPTENFAERVRHVVQAAFDGRRIILFSGGETKSREQLFEEARAIKAGGGFGSIIGRNVFQRPKVEALAMLREIIEIYRS
ncbi:MAG: class I fructose-bisphosphate aldolase [Acidobacteriota bacterium]